MQALRPATDDAWVRRSAENFPRNGSSHHCSQLAHHVVGGVPVPSESVRDGCDAEPFEGQRGDYCLGDTVGYGGSPNECADLVRKIAKKTILGNHDAAVAGRMDSALTAMSGVGRVRLRRGSRGATAGAELAGPLIPTIGMGSGSRDRGRLVRRSSTMEDRVHRSARGWAPFGDLNEPLFASQFTMLIL